MKKILILLAILPTVLFSQNKFYSNYQMIITQNGLNDYKQIKHVDGFAEITVYDVDSITVEYTDMGWNFTDHIQKVIIEKNYNDENIEVTDVIIKTDAADYKLIMVNDEIFIVSYSYRNYDVVFKDTKERIPLIEKYKKTRG